MTFQAQRNSQFNSPFGSVDIDTQLNSLEFKWIQRLLKPTNALRKGPMMYRLNLKLNSNQGLALFRENLILRFTRHKFLQNQNNEDFFRKYNAIYRTICNTDYKTQSLKYEPSFS